MSLYELDKKGSAIHRAFTKHLYIYLFYRLQYKAIALEVLQLL